MPQLEDATAKTFGKMAVHLVDAMFMFEEIERNRNMPPDAATLAQYIAKGREIRAFLTDNGFIPQAR